MIRFSAYLKLLCILHSFPSLSSETGQPSLSVDNEIHAVAGSPLTITCTYPCKYADYEKYWCKWKNTGCEPLIASEESQAGLVVSCDKGSRILSLNFDQTSLSDQGWYWCGVRKGGHYGETYATYLQVQGGELILDQSYSLASGEGKGKTPLNKCCEKNPVIGLP
uniref:Ig-like domain-containing protein n=1 Tax=Anolis carolinensis TaxID=28377 RepID=A0A803U1Q9_ANOCA